MGGLDAPMLVGPGDPQLNVVERDAPGAIVGAREHPADLRGVLASPNDDGLGFARPDVELEPAAGRFLSEGGPRPDKATREVGATVGIEEQRLVVEVGDAVGLTATPCWRRIQSLRDQGIIQREVAILDPSQLSLDISALVQIRTNDHSASWLDDFSSAIVEFPEIVEAFRTSGEIDYMLRVVVPDMKSYDDFYKRLIERVALYDVRTIFEMEELKRTTALPLDYAVITSE